MSDEWDGKVVMSTPGGPIVEMSLGDLLARKDAEIERLRASLKQFRCSCDPGACVEYGERLARFCEKGEARDVLERKP